MSAWPINVAVADDALPIAHLTLAFASCPVFDPPGKEGLSCLTNRLVCRGTQRLDYASLSDAVESLGSELLTSTQRSTVTIGGTVLTRHIEPYLQLLGDVVCTPRLDPIELEKVRREILTEQGLLLDDDNQLARYWLRRHLFDDSCVGNATIGERRSVQALSLADVRACHEENYVPERLVIGSSGQLKTDDFQSGLSNLVDRMPSGVERTWLKPDVGRINGRRVLLVDKPERVQSQIMIGRSLGEITEPERFSLKVATSSFGGTFTSRLMQEVRVKRGLSYGAYAWLSEERNANVYLLGASTDSDRTVETLRVLLDEFERFSEGGLSDDEINFARLHLLNGYPFTIETASQEASNRLRTRLAGWPSGQQERWRDYLESRHEAETNIAVRSHLSAENCAVAIVCTVTPELERQVANLEGIVDVQTVSYKDHLDF